MVQHGAIPCTTMQYQAIPCNTPQLMSSLSIQSAYWMQVKHCNSSFLSDTTIPLVLLLDLTTHQVHALGVVPGLEMSSTTILETCEAAGMVPFCSETSSDQGCFVPEKGIEKVLEKSATKQAAKKGYPYLDYVFGYGTSGSPEAFKSDISSGKIVWQKVTGDVGLSGQNGKSFYALCQYMVPTTTTTTTTTTMAPTTLSSETMVQHLKTTKCPLNRTAGTGETGSNMNKAKGLPEIDLFLNPDRKKELEEVQDWVEKNEERLTYTEVM